MRLNKLLMGVGDVGVGDVYVGEVGPGDGGVGDGGVGDKDVGEVGVGVGVDVVTWATGADGHFYWENRR